MKHFGQTLMQFGFIKLNVYILNEFTLEILLIFNHIYLNKNQNKLSESAVCNASMEDINLILYVV